MCSGHMPLKQQREPGGIPTAIALALNTGELPDIAVARKLQIKFDNAVGLPNVFNAAPREKKHARMASCNTSGHLHSLPE